MLKQQIKDLIKAGIYDQNRIFQLIYPTFKGHYARLRETIAEVKNDQG